jgi:hypothetical protein
MSCLVERKGKACAVKRSSHPAERLCFVRYSVYFKLLHDLLCISYSVQNDYYNTPEFLNNQHTKVARLSALLTGHLYPQAILLVLIYVNLYRTKVAYAVTQVKV